MTTNALLERTGALRWNDGSDLNEGIERLDALREHLALLDRWQAEGAPLTYRFGMYQGEALFGAVVGQYVASLKAAFIDPTRMVLERRLKSPTDASYDNLKTYILLNNRDHLDAAREWQAERLFSSGSNSCRHPPCRGLTSGASSCRTSNSISTCPTRRDIGGDPRRHFTSSNKRVIVSRAPSRLERFYRSIRNCAGRPKIRRGRS